MQCEACQGEGAQIITVELGRHSYFKPTVRRKPLCHACTAHALLHARPDDAAALLAFIGRFQFGEECLDMGSFREIDKMLADVTPDLLVNPPAKGKKPGMESSGDATYRLLTLKLLAECAKSLDSLAYNVNQQREQTASLIGVLSKLEGHYGAMRKMQERRGQGAPAATAKPGEGGGNGG